MPSFKDELINYGQMRKQFWDALHFSKKKSLGNYYHQQLTHIYQHLVPAQSSVLELGCGNGSLLASLKPAKGVGIDFSDIALEQARVEFPHLTFICKDAHAIQIDEGTFDYIIISELVNDLWDVQELLFNLQAYCNPKTRIIFNFYSHLWNLPLQLARQLKLAKPNLSQNWLTVHDMRNLLEISGFEVLRSWQEIICPLPIPGIASFSNRYLAKIWPFTHLALTNFMMARPIILPIAKTPSVSIIIAARNESGHIQELIERIPAMGSHTEIIFVEGNSTDDTFAVIEKAILQFPQKNLQLFKQTGKGKGDAVRLGFEKVSGDILMILDADITVPPEDLPRFYALMASGQGEFINGVRLVYPMQENAMRFLNLIGNKFFSAAFSWLLGQPIRDTLCGTKVIWKTDYERIAKGRAYFGDFDPFGDFDLLFGAARLNLKIVEVPIRYRSRRYGETNISRWSHGLLLLRMVVFAARRIKFT